MLACDYLTKGMGMHPKLIKSLELALCSSTGDAEALAALRAARRLMQDRTLAQVLEKTHNTPVHSTVLKVTLKIPVTYELNVIHNLFDHGRKHQVVVEIIHCKHMGSHVMSGMHLEVSMRGSEKSITRMESLIKRWVKEMNEKNQVAQSESTSDKKSWWQRLFG
jgi:hypothetical protein